MRVLAALSGAALGTLLHALLFPYAVGTTWLAPRFFVLLLGNFPLAVLAGLLLPVVPKRLRGGAEGGAFLLGLAVALGPLLGAWCAIGFGLGYARPVTLLASAIFGYAALQLGDRGVPRARAVHLAMAFGLPVVVFLLGRMALPNAVYELDERLRLPKSSATAQAPANAPDVLFISLDTTRADALLDPELPTPNLDALRERALWAPYAWAPAPTTIPSHLTMFTGVNALGHGVRSNYGMLPERFTTLAGELQQAGWRTLGLATLAVFRENTGIREGFEVFHNLSLPDEATKSVVDAMARLMPNATWAGILLPFPMDRHLNWYAMEKGMPQAATRGHADGEHVRHMALAYLSDLQAQEQPWFYFLHLSDPHTPYEPAPEVAGALVSPERVRKSFPEGVRGNAVDTADFLGADETHSAEAREKIEVLHLLYQEEVMLVDKVLGEVFARLEQGGRPTLIVLVGDHGEQFGEHGLMGHGNSLYAPLMDVPFALAGPGVEPGTLPAGAVRLEDMAPTVLRRLGLALPEQIEGRDLLDPTSAPAETHFHVNHKAQVAVVQGAWKLIARFENIGREEMTLEPLELYDLSSDPQELVNLIDNRQEKARELYALLQEAAANAEPGLRAEISSADAARLAALGYADDGH